MVRLTELLAAGCLVAGTGASLAQDGADWHLTGEFLSLDLPGEAVIAAEEADDTLAIRVIHVFEPGTDIVRMVLTEFLANEPSPVQHETDEEHIAAFIEGARQGNCPEAEVMEFVRHNIGGHEGNTILGRCAEPADGSPGVFVVGTSVETGTRSHGLSATIPVDDLDMLDLYIDRLSFIHLCRIDEVGGPCIEQ
ncbi:hypothetical protein HKCCE4037_18610 [Rhodobacterales bacterium HKCCE4037]|nr:hypothetical protein [Rhodobacterales bacterium HKCCE4037]